MQAAPRTEKALLNLLQNQTIFSHHNAFISRASPTAVLAQWSKTQNQSPLKNAAIAIKDNICTLDLPTTCASKTLDGFKSPFDATVVRKIRDAGGIIVGKTNLDEFGMGSHNLNSAFGATVPDEPSLSAGGSSGGSAVAVATDQCEGALGTDTGGSVRLPAAYNGILGFKPSYGLVSRWGVVAYANSLDTVGFLAKTPELVRAMCDVCNDNDSNDPTSLSYESRERIYDTIHNRLNRSHLRIGVPIEYNLEELSPVVRSAWSRVLHMLRKEGHSIHSVSVPVSKDALSAYYILGPAEASSNLAKYDNVRYGNHQLQESNQLFAKARGEGFGDEVRRRILLGAYSLSAKAIDNYFIKAQKIRRLVQNDFNKVFALPNTLAAHPLDADRDGSVDCLICPTSIGLPPEIDEIKMQSPLEQYAGDVLTVPANLAGVPAVSVPVQIPTEELEEKPKVATVGMQVITQYGDDHKALDIAALLLDLQR